MKAGAVMTIHEATRAYEAWLGQQIPLIRGDLKRKHELMREAVFPFLRATFYRWAQTYRKVCVHLMDAPRLLGVGDLHVENFGTWRDIEGRLVWGINDFDEACRLPYTSDLVRLAASALLAIGGEQLRITPARACQAILDGYRRALARGGSPFVLAEHHPALRVMAVERLKEPTRFWDKLRGLPRERLKIPASVVKALRRQLPEDTLTLRWVHRVSGLGSLGRRRFVALAECRGGTIAREAKELAISAWRWARPPKSGILYAEMLEQAIRNPDPFVRQSGCWILRRLAPDCSRIELTALPARRDAVRLLDAMGWETANVHLGTCAALVLQRDLERRGPNWLHDAAVAMQRSTVEDWKKWRARVKRS